MDYLFVGGRVGVEQTLYDLLPLDSLGDNFRNILRLYLEIAYFLRANNDNGAPLTKAVATGPPEFHLTV